MKSSIKRRLERIEMAEWRRNSEMADNYLQGRSIEDVEFFCTQGYLPEAPIPGPLYVVKEQDWKERWKQWKEFRREAASKSVEDQEFFCVHGYWPT